MAQIMWDVKRGYSAYTSVSTKQLVRWVQEGRVKKDEVLVWRSGLGGFRRLDEVDEFRDFFKQYEKRYIAKPPKRIIHKKVSPIKTICILDDEVDLGNILTKLLNEKNYQAFAPDNPTNAFGVLKRDNPDLILLDERLGNLSGIKLLPKIKKISPKSHVVMISAFGTPDLKREAFTQGAVGFMNKPFTLNKILNVIKKLSKTTDKHRLSLKV